MISFTHLMIVPSSPDACQASFSSSSSSQVYCTYTMLTRENMTNYDRAPINHHKNDNRTLNDAADVSLARCAFYHNKKTRREKYDRTKLQIRYFCICCFLKLKVSNLHLYNRKNLQCKIYPNSSIFKETIIA